MKNIEFAYPLDSQATVDSDLRDLKKLNGEMGSEIRFERQIALLQKEVDELSPSLIAENIPHFEQIVEKIARLEDQIPGNNSVLRKELFGCKVKLKNIAQTGIMSKVTSLIETSNEYHSQQTPIHLSSTLEKWRAARALKSAAEKSSLISDLRNKHATDILTVQWLIQLCKHAIKHNMINVKLDELMSYFTPEEIEESKDQTWQVKTRPVANPMQIYAGFSNSSSRN